MSYNETLSKNAAIEDYFSGIQKGQDRVELYDQLMEHEEIPEILNTWRYFENEEADVLKEYVESHAIAMKIRFGDYAQAIKNGMIIAAINCELASNAAEWDMDTFATIGYNTSCEFKIKNETFKFDPNLGAWQSASGLILPYCRDTGLPIHPMQGQG